MIWIGTLNHAGSDAVNNLTTSTPFSIPSWASAIRLQPSSATIAAAAKYASDATFLPIAGQMLNLGAANSINDLPVGRPAEPVTQVTISTRKSDAGAGTVAVFAISATPFADL